MYHSKQSTKSCSEQTVGNFSELEVQWVIPLKYISPSSIFRDYSHQPSLQKVQFPGSKSLAPAEGGDWGFLWRPTPAPHASDGMKVKPLKFTQKNTITLKHPTRCLISHGRRAGSFLAGVQWMQGPRAELREGAPGTQVSAHKSTRGFGVAGKASALREALTLFLPLLAENTACAGFGTTALTRLDALCTAHREGLELYRSR